MRKLSLLLVILLSGLIVFSQGSKFPVYPASKKNIEMHKAFRYTGEIPENLVEKKSNPTVKAGLIPSETTTMVTRYDLPTNQSTQNRIYLHPDGTVGVAHTWGISEPAFADRGSGYNYYDGSNWGPQPSARIESIRTGWPSYVPYGTNGEAVLAHDFGTPGGLVLSKRTTKGNGAWDQLTIPGPAGQSGLAWPRMVSGGSNNSTLHVIAITRPVANSGTAYQGLDGALLYSRSEDGGLTWSVQNQILPGMTSNEYTGFGGDSYAWAQPKGNTLAFVVGDNWNDLFLMKSTDNGNTWTKTVIFQHPYPMFDETKDLVLDTPTVVDGGLAVALDNSGKAHVFYGLMRVLNSDTTDGTTSYFPYTDGLAYWNEDMPTLTHLDFDTLYNNNQLVGWLQDLNGNDTVMEFVAIGTYYLALTSMPNVTIDAQDRIFLFFTMVMEHMDNGVENYRHVWARVKTGETWGDFYNANSSIIHNFDECIFPSVSPTSDNYCHLIYQADEEPGMAVRGSDPADPYTDNSIIYSKILKTEIVGINEKPKFTDMVSQNFPNPASGITTVKVCMQNPGKVGFEVSNSLGQKVFEMPYVLKSSGTFQYNIDVTGYTPGLYYYTVKTTDASVTRKMIVQ